MIKRLLFLIVSTLLISCNSEPPVIKTITVSEYSTKVILNDITEDELFKKFSIGNYPSGEQKFFLGLVGYEHSRKDTSFFDISDSYIEKKQDNKTFVYSQDNELIGVYLDKKDTSFFFYGDDLEDFSSYTVFDSDRKIIAEWENGLQLKRTFKNAKYDKYGNCIFSLIEVEFEPNGFYKDFYSELELAKKKVETKKVLIYKAEIEYY